MERKSTMLELASDLRMWDIKTNGAIENLKSAGIEYFALFQLQSCANKMAMDALGHALDAMFHITNEAQRLVDEHNQKGGK